MTRVLLSLSLLPLAMLALADEGAKPAVDTGKPAINAAKLPPAASDKVDFQKQVQPLLARCIACHGPDKQESGLRLHHKAEALAGGDNGKVIVPGKSAESRLVHLVAGLEPDSQMPPKGEGDPLTAEQIGLVRAWIDQGAAWPDDADAPPAASKHWAYQPPRRPELPPVSNADWPRNAIDHFVLARLDKEKLKPSEPADAARLLRRVSLDLTGLPPTYQEVDEFLTDNRPDAYERAVDRLLASPHYGERWARVWLDLARYADTHGFEKDPRRNMSPYRDWVIKALNDNLPFDRFTIEQLAGDLLPDATLAQKVATGFHRNTMINTEGGVDNEEYRTLAVIDRVNTTATVWLGSTLACAQCHSHKYDPFKQREYYQFYAFFNNTADSGTGQDPEIDVDAPPAAAIRAEIAELQQTLNRDTPELAEGLKKWESALKDTVKAKLPGHVRDALAIEAASRSDKQKNDLATHYRTLAPELKGARDRLAERQKELAKHSARTMVLKEIDKPRATNVFSGGNFLAKGDQVTPGVPTVLPPLAKSDKLTRLELAKWLVDPANPLTARVAVNRYWEQLFGRGLVATSEDFGTRGEPPTNPELLDFLATELVRLNWDTKALQKLIVTSATYRQSSQTPPALVERDPQNKLLARGPRFRLEAEAIRDQALAVSGLLSRKIGGPSVMPPQPDGVWAQPYSGDKWATSGGDDKHRRGLYTFWRRTAPYPAFTSFDAPSREFCVVRRPRSNTPLQALNLLNDPAYFEAAQALARRMLTEASGDATARATYGFRLALSRKPTGAETARLVKLYEQELATLRGNAKAAEELLRGAPGNRTGIDAAEWAAWTVVANVLLNLDELITRG